MLTLAEAAPVERAVVHEVSATVVNKDSASRAQFQHLLAQEAELGRGTELDFLSSSLGTSWLCVMGRRPSSVSQLGVLVSPF